MPRTQNWPLVVVLVTPLTPLVGASLGGAWTFLTAFYMFGAIPLLDLLAGTYRLNPLPEKAEALEREGRFRDYLIAAVALNFGIFLWGAWWVTAASGTGWERLGITVSVGVLTGGMGITVAHELFHRTDRLSRALGHLNLVCVGYAHYAIEHLAGHHVRVATPHDAVTARRGESLYAFLGRVVIDEARSAWRIEARRLARKSRGAWCARNRILQLVALEVALVGALVLAFGGGALAYFLGQAAVAVCLLETVNYVEHYGLRRREIAPGRYEPVDARHAWDADQRLSNLLLFNLQRHADHHLHAQTPYQTLQYVHTSPKLPTGYPGMIVLAAVPPLWRRVMEARVDALAPARLDAPSQ